MTAASLLVLHLVRERDYRLRCDGQDSFVGWMKSLTTVVQECSIAQICGVTDLIESISISAPGIVKFEESASDDLELKHQIGNGSFGVVFQARWTGVRPAETKEIVAVKVLTTSKRSLDELRFSIQRMTSEVILSSKLLHKNVIRLCGYKTEPPFYLVYELAERGSLFHVMRDSPDRKGIVFSDEPRAVMLSACADIADGLHYLHAQEPPIMHRDLKSLNVLVSEVRQSAHKIRAHTHTHTLCSE